MGVGRSAGLRGVEGLLAQTLCVGRRAVRLCGRERGRYELLDVVSGK
jgi:hypothetical protein